MIKKLLVANRGEIAVRIMRTAHAMAIDTVAVFSDPDASAPFVAAAGEAVRLPGATPAETYLRGEAVIAAAQVTGCDAVHPGYGFLSEDAAFARACAAAGLTFVGPAPEAIASMGSKLEAKALMEAAGVPVLPGGTVSEDEDLAAAGERVGFPLLVKAAFGGGGRGMRVVHEPSRLADSVEAARREAASSFGDGTVFLERFVVDPRHVEVQIVGDSQGTVVHLFERECSIQRRYQKIIEECPSPAVDETLRAELCAAAVTAAKAIGYVGVGTVEFVLTGGKPAAGKSWLDSGGTRGAEPPRGRFFFLEMNTRLQVEHPVTELVTGLDLVALQLRIADGQPLPPEVLDARIDGHAVEARLYAEDVTTGFLPATGTLHRFTVPDDSGIRVDSGVIDGSVVSPYYDPMLAKVIAHGPNRAEACRRLARALAGTRIHGLTTNRDLLVGIMREPEFLAGGTDTGYLTRHDPAVLAAPQRDAIAVHAAAAALACQAENRSTATVLKTLPSGWRNVGGLPQRVSFSCDGEQVEVGYRFTRSGVAIAVDGVALDGFRLLGARPDEVDLEIAGVRRRVAVHRVAETSYVDSSLGASALAAIPRFPDPSAAAHAGSLLAPMPGSVLRVLADAGATLSAGQPLIVLEAMKMEHTMAAPADGTLAEVHVQAGDQVDSGQVLAVVEVSEEQA